MHLPPYVYQRIVRPRWLSKLFIERIILKHQNLKDKTVLDFGCGTGVSATMCNPDRYLGLDCDSQRVKYAGQAHPAYRFQVIDNYTIPVPDKEIDIILIIAVLHHISNEDIQKYAAEFCRVLKPHGRILVIEPCFNPLYPFNNRFMKFFDNGEYIRCKEEYLQFFEKEFHIKVLQDFRKLFYNELFFSAVRF